MDKKEIHLPGITFTGDITVNGPMFDIHDNEHVHMDKPMQKEVKEDKHIESSKDNEVPRNEELFHFIHPSVDGSQEWQIHDEVKRLVKRQGIQEICQYLQQLADEKKIMLPQSLGVAYAELTRMGMPTGEGYSEKTFQKYYRK